MSTNYMFNDDVLQWCANECYHQQSGELSVAHMIRAWYYAETYQSSSFDMKDILQLGALVEPQVNANGFRSFAAFRRGTDIIAAEPIGVAPDVITRAVSTLIAAQKDLDSERFFQEFEEVHPFADGNGRVGGLLYLWHAGKLRHPIAPPEFQPRTVRGA